MLILTRNPSEIIMIGDEIMIYYISCRTGGKQIRLGFDVPKDIPVHRLEIYQQIKEDRLRGYSNEY